MNPEHEHEAQLEHEWTKQSAVIESILSRGMENYADSLDGIDLAFETQDHTLCCIDEGAPFGDMRSAGSGILTQGEERATFIANLKAGGVKEVTSHTGCGAAALYREKMGITDRSVDEVAQEGARRIAEELGIPYKGHITELDRPKEFHNARVVYVDGTGSFNPSVVEGLPAGFVVSRKFMTPEQAKTETSIAMSIAFGDHGFGKKFSHEEPLIIVAIGGEEVTSEQVAQEIAVLAGDRPVRMQKWSRQERLAEAA
ncbi:hypothetical protein HY630_00880 [Candidatus Uhrbacteria bacterium]|nr:hypothetical protein [Candidatus Uhrbacteria bacterium]